MPKYTKESFKKAVLEKHGDKYDLSKCVYKGSYENVELICNVHKESFFTSPIGLLRTKSLKEFCPKCQTNRKLSKEEFILKATHKWGHLYDFSNISFENTRSIIELNCFDHGPFLIQARFVTSNSKERFLCPICKKKEKVPRSFDYVKRYTDNPHIGNKEGIFYKIVFTHKKEKFSFLKIGISMKSSFDRYNHKVYEDYEKNIIEETIDSNLNCALKERDFILKNNARKFYFPKGYKFPGKTECFYLTKEEQIEHKNLKFFRDSLIIKQKNTCPICNNILQMPTLDHFHCKRHYGTGYARGVICNGCNRFLGMLENNAARNGIEFSELPNVLREIAFYVETSGIVKDNICLIHPTEKIPEKKFKKTCYNKLIKAIKASGSMKPPPVYPSSGKLSKKLESLFEKYGIPIEFY